MKNDGLHPDEVVVGSARWGFNTRINLSVKLVIAVLAIIWGSFSAFAAWAYFDNQKTFESERSKTDQELKKVEDSVHIDKAEIMDKLNKMSEKFDGDLKEVVTRLDEVKSQNSTTREEFIREASSIKGDVSTLRVMVNQMKSNK